MIYNRIANRDAYCNQPVTWDEVILNSCQNWWLLLI